jgi:hypothetical protein
MNELDPNISTGAGSKPSRPWFQKKRFIIPIGLVLVIGIASAMGGNNSSNLSPNADQSDTSQEESSSTEVEVPEFVPPVDLPEEEVVEDNSSSETNSQYQARSMASDYLDTMAFSLTGLIEQLEYEGFSKADATYGAKAIDADWNEQAALAAEAYLDTMSFSRSGLIEQLIFEGFTPAQAKYGVDAVGL